MVLLAAAALFFGNCFSCPQMLLAGLSHQPQHNCCPGPQPVSASCHAQGMQHFVKADGGAQPVVLPVVAELIGPPTSMVLAKAPFRVPAPAEHGPPGILSLRIDRKSTRLNSSH